MLKLDMGGRVVPGSTRVEKSREEGMCQVYVDVHGCDEYPEDTIGWLIAETPHSDVAKMIAERIETAAQES